MPIPEDVKLDPIDYVIMNFSIGEEVIIYTEDISRIDSQPDICARLGTLSSISSYYLEMNIEGIDREVEIPTRDDLLRKDPKFERTLIGYGPETCFVTSGIYTLIVTKDMSYLPFIEQWGSALSRQSFQSKIPDWV